MLKKLSLLLFALLFSLFGISAFAAPVDLSSLTDSVDFSTTITAVLLVAAALAGVAIAWKGAKIVLRALGFSM